MDEVLLNDLLECSVCLERLDTSSRVLPCQHTFCLKCLKVIVESHKELRCPECRILVETNVDELPPNVLLMRILEGMRNSAPRKLPGPTQRATRGGTLVTQQGLQSSARAESKQLPPHARAMYDYITKEASDLSFKKGETILLLKKLDPFWYQGECSGRTGMFPITYVQVVVPLPIPAALCKALYDFRMSAPDEEGCLAFDKGSIITVHRRVDENWAEGRLDHRVGIFPIAFVELNQSARQLMNSTPLNRPVPALPDLSRAGHSEHRSHTQHPHRYQQMSMSTPANVQGNYQNMASMSQSHPNYQTQQVLVPTSQILVPQTINHAMTTISSHGGLVTAVPRNIMEPTQQKHSLNDLIHFTNIQNKASHQGGGGTVGVQSVSRIGENFRPAKYDSYNNTPVHKTETTYQNVRTSHDLTANFNANSSDSSSSVNTQSNQTNSSNTPNTSSDTSTCESNEPSLPSSPDNNTERNQTVITTVAQNRDESNNENETSLNTSMGVLSLNESSTATNTSLNVTLPPTDSPKLNQSTTGTSQSENQEGTSSDLRLDTPSSSKSVRSGPESLLNFGLGLQAVLSPSHGKDNYMVSRAHRDHHHREREKRHSLTASSHLQGNHSTQNRHSAEILATSLLDHTPERDRDSVRSERERERRRRRSRSNERPLPSAYIALYPYKPQKPDELELKKGGIYTVTERCRDGWYKGCSERSGRCGVFPGNYVAPHPAHTPHPAHPIRHKHDKSSGGSTTSASGTSVASGVPAPSGTLAPPDAPPRAQSPLAQHTVQPLTYPWSAQVQQQPQSTPKSDKLRDKPKSEKSSSGGVGLMRRLAAIKRSKSPTLGHCIDNPVFEDSPGPSPRHPVHVRTVNEGPWQTQHRKSQSLDVTATRRDRHHSQTVKERFRCIVPYPPNSEYELELKVDDIVIVSKKRGDGWYKGTLQRTGRTGLFPASFVQSCPQE